MASVSIEVKGYSFTNMTFPIDKMSAELYKTTVQCRLRYWRCEPHCRTHTVVRSAQQYEYTSYSTYVVCIRLSGWTMARGSGPTRTTTCVVRGLIEQFRDGAEPIMSHRSVG